MRRQIDPNSDTDESLEDLCQTLRWNWDKKPADPAFRAELAAQLRESRSDIFNRLPAGQRRKTLASLHRFHQNSRAKMEEEGLYKSEAVIRRISERKLAAFCLWRFCGWRFQKSDDKVQFISPSDTQGAGTTGTD